MAVKKDLGPVVVGIVDEAAGKVTVAVQHGDHLLPVATASLDHALSLDYGSDDTAGNDSDDTEGGI